MHYLINTNWNRIQLLQYQLRLTSQQMTCAVTMARAQPLIDYGFRLKTAKGIEALEDEASFRNFLRMITMVFHDLLQTLRLSVGVHCQYDAIWFFMVL